MKKILFLVALVISSPAEAASWRLVGETANGRNKAWIDVDSIKRGSEAIGAWHRISLGDGSWATGFSAFRCETKMYMDLRLTFYSPDGSSTNMDKSLKGEWTMPVPDSLMEGVLEGVCAE
jgi:hypothetical protein